MGGQDAADAPVGHTTKQPHPRRVVSSWIHPSDDFGTDNNGDNNDCCGYHPKNELLPPEQRKQLVQAMCWLANCAKGRNEHGTGTNQQGAN